MIDPEKREMVCALAEKVMGWKIRERVGSDGQKRILADEYEDGIGCVMTWGLTENTAVRKWRPMEEIADAWMIVEALKKRNIGPVMIDDGAEYSVFFSLIDDLTQGVEAAAQKLPDALCRAALKAVSA